MKSTSRILSAALAAFATLTAAWAAAAAPALIYSVGGKFDGSFNQAAYTGAERYRAETGEDYVEFEIRNPTDSKQALLNFARRGHTPIVAIGFNHASAIAEVAPKFPKTQFAIVDSVVDDPNVRSMVYREHEGSYIVGLLAAMASKSHIIGFVGGMDIPLIRKFACGYIQGARSIDAEAWVLINMTGDTPAAWTDPVRGAELARSQIERGADVVLQAAGGTGIGVLQAVADAGVLGIGTDSNQNGLHPGHVLTSMRKRVDLAVYRTFMDVREDRWTAGIRSLGLKEGGLDWVVDKHNKALITPDMKAAADAAAGAIASGAVTVHDTTKDGPCPVR